ncbi:uncharacterized protein LOC119671751 [Teleopsis dalmanni]|uniref:uncharacterized protein LOC119666453 n=1 Tax=Teleopsis dalmanni TaxID=139649 RepID=UPI0018CCFB5F|nr:uncharacterized protein LOC119666453 [Teleopsis dalmanni]XP_037938440.1 uncharacterized protein LOC119671751 [Teleopsis dalmanni]
MEGESMDEIIKTITTALDHCRPGTNDQIIKRISKKHNIQEDIVRGILIGPLEGLDEENAETGKLSNYDENDEDNGEDDEYVAERRMNTPGKKFRRAKKLK